MLQVGVGEIERAVGGETIAFSVTVRVTTSRRGSARQCNTPPDSRCDERCANRADDFDLRELVVNRQRVEAILRCQRVAQFGAVQGNRGDAPARVWAQQPIDIPGLVHAMKGAGTEMQDAGMHARGVVAAGERPVATGQASARTTARHRVTPLFQMAISRSPLISSRAGSPGGRRRRRDRATLVRRASHPPAPQHRRPHRNRSSPACAAPAPQLEAIFSVGTGNPSGVPRPVVNSRTVAPAAASAVEETASLPGASSSASPRRSTCARRSAAPA